MIIGRDYVFLHVPKTGGTWIRAALRLSGTIEQEFKDHLHFNGLPEDVKKSNRMVFAFVRNPWDWYLSLYTHYHHSFLKSRNEFSLKNRGTPVHGFLVERFGGSLGQMLEHMREDESQSASLEKLSEGCGDITLFRYEDGLADCLLRFLGPSMNDQAIQKIDRLRDSRFNSHFQYREFVTFTPEHDLLVRAREASIIERFDYLPLAK